jgi:hypothetical protein
MLQLQKGSFEEHFGRGLRWPYQRSLFRPEPLRQPPAMERSRKPTKFSFRSGKMQRTVACESSVEVDFCRHLDRLPQVLYYQEQPHPIPYRDKGRTRRYHPDLLVSLVDGRSVLIEIKQNHDLAMFKNILKWDAMAQYCEQSGMGFFIGDHRTSLHDLLVVAEDRRLDREVMMAVERRALDWPAIKQLQGNHGRHRSEITAAMLRCELYLEDKPFLLRSATEQEREVIARLKSWFLPPKERSNPIAFVPARREGPETAPARQVATTRRHPLQVTASTRNSPNAYKKWTDEEQQQLLRLFDRGADIKSIADALGRQHGGIRRRLQKLGRISLSQRVRKVEGQAD